LPIHSRIPLAVMTFPFKVVLLVLLAVAADASQLPYGVPTRDPHALRAGLDNARIRFDREGAGRVAFLGGSITQNPGWRDLVCEDLQRRFPETSFDFVPAGIASMGSTPGAFRLERDVLSRGRVDLLFVEAAVNDAANGRSPAEMLRGMEGIVRRARLENPAMDVVLMHFADPAKLEDYRVGQTPEVIARHERVAKRYGAPSIDLALEVTQRIEAGEFTWEEDFRDLHPSPFGQRLYHRSIARLLDAAWSEPLAEDAALRAHPLPSDPLDPFCYDAGRIAHLSTARPGAGWHVAPSWQPDDGAGTRAGFVRVPMLVAEQPGATLILPFEGRGAGVWVAAGPDAGALEHRVDGGPWQRVDLFSRWSGRLHLPRLRVLAAELDGGPHELEIRVAEERNPQSRGHAARIAAFVVNGPRPDPRADWILIEAEEPLEKVSDNPSFARTFSERWASDRACLVGFYGQGRCTWAFELEEEGERVVWLRYASLGDTSIRAGLDVADGSELFESPLPATPALEGKHCWGWAPLLKGPLAAGRHVLTLEASPVRPDCMLITSSEWEPDYLRPRAVSELDRRTRELLAHPVVEARPRWLDAVQGYQLPAWYEERRVCLHTRLSPRWREDPLFGGAAEAFRSLGADVFVRHLRTGGEGAWWPSAVGAVEPWAAEEDVARGIIMRAHAADCRIIAYFRHMEDRAAAERHPDWACRDDLGRLITKRTNSPRMCFNSPWADQVLVRLLELVDRGADAFYFDEDHMPVGGCWCGFCRNAFRELTGLEHPVAVDDEDPIWRKLVEFTNLTIERTFLRYRAALHARDPEVVLLVGSFRSPDLFDRQPSGRLLRLADSVKTEFGKGASERRRAFFRNHPELHAPSRDTGLALGWTLSRDGADGRPPHVWVHNLQDEASALHATAGLIAHGCIANLDCQEDGIPDPQRFAAAIALGRRLSPHFTGLRPLRWAAIHYPERARDRLAPDEVATWREALSPMVGAWDTLLRQRLPVGIVHDNQLAEGALDGYRLLVLPTTRDLTDEMRSAERAFRERGGIVIAPGQEWAWHDPGGSARTRDVFSARIQPLALMAPVQVMGGPEKMHAVSFTDPDGERLLVALVNDFSWVWAGRRELPGGAPMNLPEGTDVAPEPCRDVLVEIRLPFRPVGCTEVVEGAPLELERSDDRTRIRVPPFEVAAVLELELQ